MKKYRFDPMHSYSPHTVANARSLAMIRRKFKDDTNLVLSMDELVAGYVHKAPLSYRRAKTVDQNKEFVLYMVQNHVLYEAA